MSHEGIRFLTAEEIAQQKSQERALAKEATDPLKVRVDKTGGTGMEIDWRDGHRSAWTFAWLRDACPCATCHDERDTAGRKPGEPKPKAASPLQMYQAPVRPKEATPVGRYALRFAWNDGHESGIYSWDYLRRVCCCEECARR